RMGGLIHGMPHTAFFFLIGCISISALPPFNGFVSEWLTFQAALQVSSLQSGVLRSLIPTTAAALALTGALAAACFVKVYGITFLGKPRTHRAGRARMPSAGMRAGQSILAALCLVFGLLPTTTITALERIAAQLLGQGLPSASAQGWLWLTPVSPRVASYAAPLVFAALVAVWAIAWLAMHPRGKTIRTGVAAWDCGFGGLTHRMQYSATAFAMPFRRIFSGAWRTVEQIEENNPPVASMASRSLHYRLQVEDHAWPLLYLPVRKGVLWLARLASRLQTGNVRIYLGYSFFTLIFLLWVVT
ncbi:MAG: hydrogenase 4 subunit B, partial [Gammaproteobacteria bacterium]